MPLPEAMEKTSQYSVLAARVIGAFGVSDTSSRVEEPRGWSTLAKL